MHESHRAAWFRGVLYSSQCGHFSPKFQSLRGLAKTCNVNPMGRYCKQTMGTIRHDQPRPGFKGWPKENNVPGKEENTIANIAYPDPEEADTPLPRKYEKKTANKTPTGEAIAIRVRDMRQMKNHKVTDAAEEADFEEELKAYNEGTFSAP